MTNPLDWKDVLALAATFFSIVSFAPYIWQILRRKTEPHLYTWLIWSITFSIAGAGVWFGGGGFLQSLGFLLSAVLVFAVTILSFWYGTKNITVGDGVILALALVSVFAWIGLDNPLLAVLMATGIDLIGYVPTYRKSFAEPRTENLLTWVGFTIAPFLGLLALHEYNLMTVAYSAATLAANAALIGLLVIRRGAVKR